MPTKAPAVSKQDHRVNEIEARKVWVQTVRIYCSSVQARIKKLAYGTDSPRRSQ